MTPRKPKSTLRLLFAKWVPAAWKRRIRMVLWQREVTRTRKIFALAANEPQWLPLDLLPQLCVGHSFAEGCGYEPAELAKRGSERAAKLVPLFEKYRRTPLRKSLELGCWDGMVSYSMQKSGFNATATDIRDEGFEKAALCEGVKLFKMDASRLVFPDESFGLVFSFDAFEHFSNPEAVMQEALRVTQPGGLIYLEFGPLFFSPMGLHAYRSIPLPYCQLLFTHTQLTDYAEALGYGKIDYLESLNGRSLAQYRDLWKSCKSVADIIFCNEIHDYSALQLIRTYPSCFRSKTDDFANLTVSTLEILLRKH